MDDIQADISEVFHQLFGDYEDDDDDDFNSGADQSNIKLRVGHVMLSALT